MTTLFSKRHYQFFAKKVSTLPEKERKWLADYLAFLFQGDNFRFDKERFLKACDVRKEVK